MPPAIRVENLGKKYRLGATHSRSIGELVQSVARMFRRQNGHVRPDVPMDVPNRVDSEDNFWALRDVSFEVQPGDVVGIIGRNGAGKSTLLKILSQIVAPSTGRIELYGRAASLLEVGTGFHPELTGRENVYLNGAILGMSKTEVGRRFDEIVAFAEVERFLDTPVKRYSSGMYVRLAFAVAAHLDPEIFIVDEVLAVGDHDFQQKCFTKVRDVATGGKTVLLVSHNIAAVQQLCDQAILLADGNVSATGQVASVLRQYTETAVMDGQTGSQRGSRPSWARPWITAVRMTTASGEFSSTFQLGNDLGIEFDFRPPKREALSGPVMGVAIKNASGAIVGAVNTCMTAQSRFQSSVHSGTFHCRIIAPPLLQGTYTADVWLGHTAENIDCIEDAVAFQILATDVYGTGRVPYAGMGCIFLNARWALDGNTSEGCRIN